MAGRRRVSPHDALQEARALIADPAHWTKSAACRNDRGRSISPVEAGGVQWTGTGALMAVSRIRTNAPGAAAYSRAAIGRVDLCALGRWEDDRATTHAMVLAAFDSALLSTGNAPQPGAAVQG